MASGTLTFLYFLELASNRSSYNLCVGHTQKFQVKAFFFFLLFLLPLTYFDSWVK
jgi:hypothetical protein